MQDAGAFIPYAATATAMVGLHGGAEGWLNQLRVIGGAANLRA